MTCVRRLAVGAVVLNAKDEVLLVFNRGPNRSHWSLPKGSCEVGEPLKETLIREVKEETGLDVELDEMAFVTEWYMATRKEWYLQFYFSVKVVAGEAGVQLTDDDVTAVRWVPQDQIRTFMNYRPWVEPLLNWLKERRPGYHLF